MVEAARHHRKTYRDRVARYIAHSMLSEYGWSGDQFSCFDDLWIGERQWDLEATDRSSGAYGIPHVISAEKVASAGGCWESNAATQIERGPTTSPTGTARRTGQRTSSRSTTCTDGDLGVCPGARDRNQRVVPCRCLDFIEHRMRRLGVRERIRGL